MYIQQTVRIIKQTLEIFTFNTVTAFFSSTILEYKNLNRTLIFPRRFSGRLQQTNQSCLSFFRRNILHIKNSRNFLDMSSKTIITDH